LVPHILQAAGVARAQLNGFRLVEATEAQLRNLMVETIQEIQFSYVPIFDFPKVEKTYIEVNK